MSMRAQMIITAVVLEGRPVAQVAAEFQVHRAWVYKLLARYRTEGEAAFEPRSRRPHTVPRATDPAVVDLVVNLRQELTAQGLDAGAHTIAWHLHQHHAVTLSPATIWRHLKAAGLIQPTPSKRPKTSYIRFEATLPNELWQTDFTHVRLADTTDVEVLTFIDDHSRYVVACTAHRPVRSTDVVTTFRAAISDNGIPAAVLSDNGRVFTARLAGGRHATRNAFQTELARLHIEQRNSRPNHPTTCGKVERVQQTLKKWLAAHPPARDLPELQALLDTWREHYNTRRPHRSLHARTPAAAYTARPKAGPTAHTSPDERYRTDRVDAQGTVTLRHAGRLHHIGIGRPHAGQPILLIVRDRHIRIIDAITGELIRELTLDPTRDYQPQKHNSPNPQ
ncbi:IS481 family transposase [Cellulomonas hominis]